MIFKNYNKLFQIVVYSLFSLQLTALPAFAIKSDAITDRQMIEKDTKELDDVSQIILLIIVGEKQIDMGEVKKVRKLLHNYAEKYKNTPLAGLRVQAIHSVIYKLDLMTTTWKSFPNFGVRKIVDGEIPVFNSFDKMALYYDRELTLDSAETLIEVKKTLVEGETLAQYYLQYFYIEFQKEAETNDKTAVKESPMNLMPENNPTEIDAEIPENRDIRLGELSFLYTWYLFYQKELLFKSEQYHGRIEKLAAKLSMLSELRPKAFEVVQKLNLEQFGMGEDSRQTNLEQ